MDERTRLQAREFLLRGRLYRFMALCSVGVGGAVFLLLYFRHIEGHFLESFKNPVTVLIVLLPFLPAFILTRMAVKAEQKFRNILEESASVRSEND